MQTVKLHKPFTVPTRKQIAEARRIAKVEFGVNYLLSINSDPKTIKSNKSGKGYLTAIQYFAPAKESGFEVCAARSAGCTAACLHTAGNPAYFKNKSKARKNRTKLFFLDRTTYEILLYAELVKFVRKCEILGLKPAVRLNGTSDIVWERVCAWIFQEFPQVQFYDYTKIEKRMHSQWSMPENYDLTFSRSEDNQEAIERVLASNPLARVAVVFSTKRTGTLPTTYLGYTVGDADKDDLRFTDTSRIAGLRAKGDARTDDSGFVVAV